MNTPAHLVLGIAVFGRPNERRLVLASALGALLPDLSLYLMAGAALFIFGYPAGYVFDTLYFSDAWQTVFAIDNSVVLWGGLLCLAILRKSGWAGALCGAALLHLAFDFPLHHDDGRPHFWPLTGWVFESPYSYWDMRRGANIIAPLEAALVAIAAIWFWLRRPDLLSALAVLVLVGLELWVVRGWFHFIA